jgi:hypothetical protein
MPLSDLNHAMYKGWSESAQYEFVFRITGQFADESKSISFGDFRAVLAHERILENGQHIFRWKVFSRTNEKIEQALKLEREKNMGSSFP